MKKKKKTKKKKNTNKQNNKNKQTWTHNEDSHQPDHPSSLNRILASSCALIMGSQGIWCIEANRIRDLFSSQYKMEVIN